MNLVMALIDEKQQAGFGWLANHVPFFRNKIVTDRHD
jgi:hypothetical protein